MSNAAFKMFFHELTRKRFKRAVADSIWQQKSAHLTSLGWGYDGYVSASMRDIGLKNLKQA